MAYRPTLKPCPFCGGEAAYKNIPEPYGHGWVGCPKCKAYINWAYDPRTAVAKWNKRAEGDLVRCKECKHLDTRNCPIDGLINLNGYCDRGERKDD